MGDSKINDLSNRLWSKKHEKECQLQDGRDQDNRPMTFKSLYVDPLRTASYELGLAASGNQAGQGQAQGLQ